MRRREFIVGLGSAAAWPVAARAQQGDRIRRIARTIPIVFANVRDPVASNIVSVKSRAGVASKARRQLRFDAELMLADIARERGAATSGTAAMAGASAAPRDTIGRPTRPPDRVTSNARSVGF